jgi:hypothetical protein
MLAYLPNVEVGDSSPGNQHERQKGELNKASQFSFGIRREMT